MQCSISEIGGGGIMCSRGWTVIKICFGWRWNSRKPVTCSVGGLWCKWFFSSGKSCTLKGIYTGESTRIAVELVPGSLRLFPHKITRHSTRNDNISRSGMTKGGRSILGPRSLVGQIAVAETTLIDCLCTKDGRVVADHFFAFSIWPNF